MYSLLYRKLPGGTVAKVIQLVLIAALVIAALFLFVFPTVDQLINEDPSING